MQSIIGLSQNAPNTAYIGYVDENYRSLPHDRSILSLFYILCIHYIEKWLFDAIWCFFSSFALYIKANEYTNHQVSCLYPFELRRFVGFVFLFFLCSHLNNSTYLPSMFNACINFNRNIYSLEFMEDSGTL